MLKAMNAEYPQPEELTRYRHEYDIAGALAELDCVVHPLGLEHRGNGLLLCLSAAASSRRSASRPSSCSQRRPPSRSKLLPVIRTLADLDRGATAAGGADLDPETLHHLLAKLRELIEDYDAEAADVAEELVPRLRRAGPGEAIDRLIEEVGELDFDAALETLGRIEEGVL